MPEERGKDILPAGERIHEQVILPWNIAIRITLRGLKIRLGRSLITMSGVVLGIAFLMSVLSGDAFRAGLAAETRTKTEVTRLVKLIEDEVGTFKGRKIAVLISGPVTDEHKRRMLERIAARSDPQSIAVFATQPDRLVPATVPIPAEMKTGAFKLASDFADCVRDAHVLLLLDRELPRISDAALAKYLASMRQPVLLDYYHGRYDEAELQKINPKIVYSSLSYQMSEAEIKKAQRRKAQQEARSIWITVVSMLVTVIGIANAMLMSVTERIREIGTMKCLGALSKFVVKLFLIESLIIGVLGAVFGTILGFLVPFMAYMLSAGASLLVHSTPFLQLAIYGLASIAAGTGLAIVAAIYPAVVAARMVPADALRTNV
ncbi:MAG: FtsX-like permease family protein [Kiritimatiellaeota bacterium]|nr:FtsX-like permease family protein [Kiritimatiellota bacterium]